jgi:hypothetical protein
MRVFVGMKVCAKVRIRVMVRVVTRCRLVPM